MALSFLCTTRCYRVSVSLLYNLYVHLVLESVGHYLDLGPCERTVPNSCLC